MVKGKLKELIADLLLRKGTFNERIFTKFARRRRLHVGMEGVYKMENSERFLST
jgi:hypothetical protein